MSTTSSSSPPRRPESREQKLIDVPVPNSAHAIRNIGYALDHVSRVGVANLMGRVPMDEQAKTLLGKIENDLVVLQRTLEQSIPDHPWRALGARGREWTIEEVFARWRATYRKSPASTRVPKDYAVARVREAIDAGQHREFNGALPSWVFRWMDCRAFDNFPTTSGASLQ